MSKNEEYYHSEMLPSEKIKWVKQHIGYWLAKEGLNGLEQASENLIRNLEEVGYRKGYDEAMRDCTQQSAKAIGEAILSKV